MAGPIAPHTKFEVRDPGGVLAALPPFIPFQAGPTSERIQDDVLHEILSHLPTLNDRHVLFGGDKPPRVIPSHSLVRMLTLRVLSQTSQLLQSRCLVMAWRRVELCGVNHVL